MSGPAPELGPGPGPGPTPGPTHGSVVLLDKVSVQLVLRVFY